MSGTSGLQRSCALSLVICTFHREVLLRRALESVAAQAAPAGFEFEILVIDNSDEASARGVVAAIADRCPFPLHFVEAHPANISVARNAGVAASAGAAIAFLDDDQQLAPGWLQAVARALRACPHDAFFGAVDPVWEAPHEAGAMARALFTRRRKPDAGMDLIAYGPDKTRDIVLSTANSIFRRASLPHDGRLFDPAFGAGGGEDYDLICRMQREGRRLGWLPDAAAREFVPASRCENAYLRRRFFAGGQAYAAAIANVSSRPRLARWAIRLKAAAQCALLLARTPLAAARGGSAIIDHLHVVAGALGKLSFADIKPIYRDNARASPR